MGRTGNKNHPNIERPEKPTLPPMKPDDFAAAGQRAAADPRRLPGAHGAEGDARRAGHLRRLRPRLGERVEHAVPRVQALGPRGRHQHAADRPLADGHRRDERRTA